MAQKKFTKPTIEIEESNENLIAKISVKFYLNTFIPKGKKEIPINCYAQINRWWDNYKPLKFATGISVNPDYWDKKNHKATGVFESINMDLDIYRNVVKTCYTDSLEFGQMPDDLLIMNVKREYLKAKKELNQHATNLNFTLVKDQIINPSSQVPKFKIEKSFNTYKFSNKIDTTKVTFAEYIRLTTDKIEAQKIFDHRTICRYNNLLEMLNTFHKKTEIDHVVLNEISTEYFESFILWIKENYDFKLNYFNTYKKNLRKFYNYAKAEDKLKLPEVIFSTSVLKKKSEKSKSVSLSIDQLKNIIDLNFIDKEKDLGIFRDIFIIGCLTGGLRISDLKRLNTIQSTIIDKKVVRYIESYSTKTNNYVKLPLFKPAEDALNRLDDTIPKFVEQTLNKALKEIAQRAGLNLTIKVSNINIKTNKKIELNVPMYEMISSKTARKTFCTLMITHYKQPVTTVMAFSGHESIDSFESYISDSGYDAMFNDFAKLAAEDQTFKK